MPVSELSTEVRALLAGFAADEHAVAGLAATTVRNHGIYLTNFARWWAALRPGQCLTQAGPADMSAFLIAEAGRGLAPPTRRSELAALRRFYAWLVLTGQSLNNPAVGLPTTRVPPSQPGLYTPAQSAAILAHTADAERPTRSSAPCDRGDLALHRDGLR